MFQRSFLRQSRNLQFQLQSRSLSSTRRPTSPFLNKTQIAPTTRLRRRWVTTDAEEKTIPQNETSTPPEGSQQGAQEAARQQSAEGDKHATKDEDVTKKQTEAKDREIIDLKDKYLRSVAEFRNLQDRTTREMSNARSFAIQRFATDLLESIDNLDRALGAVPSEALSSGENKDLNNLHSGLRMTESILLNTLKKHGLERFDPLEQGKKFDPKEHEAVFMAPHGEKADGDVLMTQSKGFMLNGRVLRAAKVGVVKNQ